MNGLGLVHSMVGATESELDSLMYAYAARADQEMGTWIHVFSAARMYTHAHMFRGWCWGSGGAQRQSRGDTTHPFPHCTSSLAAMVCDGPVGMHACMHDVV